MPIIHIVGFGEQVRIGVKARWEWYRDFPKAGFNVNPGDALVLNLLVIRTSKQVSQLQELVNQLIGNGGTIVVVTAPIRSREGNVTNYSFLPWPPDCIAAIRPIERMSVHYWHESPEWIHSHFQHFLRWTVSPICFGQWPSGTHILATSGDLVVSLFSQDQKGRILLIPPIQSVLLETRSASDIELLSTFLTSLVYIVGQFAPLTEEKPAWLDEIRIRNEEELRQQYAVLQQQLSEIGEEKAILNDDGPELTVKVAAIFRQLGFRVEEKEVKGAEDIEIAEDGFRAVVECSGSKHGFDVDKVRQLIDYVAEEGCRGIFVANPWRNLHPRERELPKAFTQKVLERAAKLKICVMTVPQLFGASLDATGDKEKAKVRESIRACEGLWQYPARTWA